MTKKFVFRSNKYNITHQDLQRGVDNRGYINENYLYANESDPLNKWHTYRAERNNQNIFISSSTNVTRMQIHDAVNRLYNDLQGSNINITAEKSRDLYVGFNYNKEKIYYYVEEYLLKNPSQAISFVKDPQQFLINLPGLSIKNILIYQGGDDKNNTTLPFLKTNIGEKVGHHKDGTFEKGLQGPFNESNVGGYQHRHQKLGKTLDRPERFNISDDGTTIIMSAPISSSLGLNYNISYSRFSRDGFTKSAVNIKNIKASGSNSLGNFTKNYEIVNGLSRRNQNLALVDRPQNFSFSNIDSPYVSGTTDYGLPDRRLLDGTYNKTVFVNKFGAPGDPQSSSPVFMDAESEEYSAYNTINYRNSGPRTYLKGFLSSPSYFGGYKSSSFGVSASYQKTQRNNRRIPVSGTSNFRLREDNKFISYNIPTRDGGYLWINSYASGGVNSGLYRNGVDNDIVFITSSNEGISFTPIGGNYITVTTSSITLNPTENNVLRKYNVQFNGMWNFSSKKQLSQNFNKILIRNKKENYFCDYVNDPSVSSDQKKDIKFRDSFINNKHKNIINVYEDSEGNEEKIYFSFGQDNASLVSDIYRPEYNHIINIYNDQKNIKTSDKSKSLFNKLLNFDRYSKQNNLNIKKIKQVKLIENIYPKSQNVYRNFARARNAYTQSWADSLDNRLTELTNSQGQVYAKDSKLNQYSPTIYNYSYWPMDADTYLDGATGMFRDKSGELTQIDNIGFYNPYYGRDPELIVPSGSYYGARFGRNWNTNRPANVVHEQAGKGPYPSSYEHFYSDIKLIGQDCSVVPEYRISPKLDLYYSNAINLFDDDFNSLDLSGTAIEDSSIALSVTSAFLEQRATSDYIDLNGYMNEQLDNHKLDYIKLSVKTIKKLLPYDDFYPQKRTLKLAQQFSSSYSSVFNLGGTQPTFRTVLTPLYAPGIAYNSIKSGVGMPFSVVKYNNIRINNYSAITSSISSGSTYYQKLPWDTILYPYKRIQQISGSTIYDIDPNMIIDSTASVQSEISYNIAYDYMANNFYSEVINFFKSSGQLTSLKSKPMSDWYFPDLTKKYTLDIIINKQSDYLTYSSLENYGPKPYAFHAPPWYRIGQALATASSYNSDSSIAPNAFGGAGYSYARITFDPASLAVGGLDYFVKGKFDIGDIIRNSTIEYQSSIFGGSTSSAAIQINDIVDIFNVSSDGNYWQPKLNWECPTADLNFYGLSAKLTNSSGNDAGDATIGSAIRGIWHQYAPICNNDKGLFLTVKDYINDSTTTGSLLDVVKFDQSDRNKIGKISPFKEIQEALIIIPFYVDNCGEEKYFDINIDLFERMYENNNGIVGDIKVISRKYVLPPSLDFIRLRDIANTKLTKEQYGSVKSPCLIFPFEFSSILSNQDLADIWQGVMPSVSTTAEVDYKEKSFFIGNYLRELNFKLPDNTRFKVFKVKKRAVTNYQNIIDRTKGDDYLDISYGYNWPYDYFSLIEMAEVKAELSYSEEINDDERVVEDDVLNKRIVQNELIGNSGVSESQNSTTSPSNTYAILSRSPDVVTRTYVAPRVGGGSYLTKNVAK